ncbi:MAG TPA: FtsX-like permease family protein [Stellaceae bacterium]|nr:FtsX-like permease family protein [Stellaceae bacterium]
MVVVAAPARSAGSTSIWLQAIRLTRRELRAELWRGLKGFRIFLACLALGVAAIAGVGSVSASILAGLAADARGILGGDLEFALVQRAATPAERAVLDRFGIVSEARSLRGMLRRIDGDRRTLVELKAVDGAYPLYGAVTLQPDQGLAAALAPDAGGTPGVAVDPLVLDRLALKLGDRVQLGDAVLRVAATLLREPDSAGNPFSLGPPVLVPLSALPSTGLMQPGSLSTTLYRLRLPPSGDVAAARAEIERATPDAGWRVRDFTNAAPSIQQFIDRTSMFLTLVGLTALLVGGVGVGNAVSSYLGGKTGTIATLKCLGASGRLIFTVYLMQILVLATLGIAIGLALGAVAPYAVVALFADKLPVAARLGLYPAPLALATAFGLLTALVFSLWPLARARDVPAAALFRALIVAIRRWPRWPDMAVVGGLALGLAALAVASAADRRLAFWFVLGALVALGAFRLAGAAVMALARAVPRQRSPTLRLAIANLHRPGAPTPSVVLSLGLGLTVFVAIALIQGNLSLQVAERLPAMAPSYFFIDIQVDQAADFDRTVHAVPGVDALERVPSLRARITRLNGVPAETAPIAADTRWSVRGDRGLTYAAALPRGSTIVAGTWWPADYQGPPLASLDAELAKGLGLGLGDTISFNVLGREITAKIANLRRIEWNTLGINFFTVFAPGTLEAAPQTFIATAHATSPAAEIALERAVTDRFPNVSAIRVKDALDTVGRVLGNMADAVRLTAAITLVTGILVLSGALAAGHRRRVYDTVVLKVLGATRAMVARTFLIEYGLLGLVTATISGGLGTLAGWLIVTRLMRAEWVFLPGTVLLTAGISTLLTLAIGFAGTWRALGVKAAGELRNE